MIKSFYEFNKVISKIQGSKLINVNLFANMVCLVFKFDGKEYFLHLQTYTRFINNNQIVVTSFDYTEYDYMNKDESIRDKENDLWINLKTHKSEFIDNKVISVNANEFGDLTITMNDNVRIEAYVTNSTSNFQENIEQYRFFEDGENSKHYIVYNNKNIE